jgi:phosphatidylglycerol:prolipoprotein diacylglycerol transferase
MQQVLFRLGGVPLYGYGFMLFLAFLACIYVSGRLAKRQGISKEIVQDLAIWIFLGGLIGARTTWMLLESHVKTLGEFVSLFFRLWQGGVIFYGGAIGGALAFGLAYFFQLRKQPVSTWKLVDIIAPSVALGLCLGRIGCLLNGCCFGQVSCPHCVGIRFPMAAPARFEYVARGYQTAAGFTLEDPLFPSVVDSRTVATVDPNSAAAAAGLKPGDVITEVNGDPVKDAAALNHAITSTEAWRGHSWKMELTVLKQGQKDKPQTLEFAPMTLPIYPTQVYESISMFLLFLFLLAYTPFRRHDGQVIAVLMIGYGFHRYFNEMLRGDIRPTGFENWTSLVLIAAGAALFVWLWRQPAQYKSDVSPVPATG